MLCGVESTMGTLRGTGVATERRKKPACRLTGSTAPASALFCNGPILPVGDMARQRRGGVVAQGAW